MIQMTDTPIHGTDPNSFTMQLLSDLPFTQSDDLVIRWGSENMVGGDRVFWNTQSLLVRAEDESLSYWTTRVVSEYLFRTRTLYAPPDGPLEAHTGGVFWQAKENLLDVGPLLLRWRWLNEFIGYMYESANSSREKHVIMHPSLAGRFVSIDYTGMEGLPHIGANERGWRIDVEGGGTLWLETDEFIEDKTTAYIFDTGNLVRVEKTLTEKGECICPCVMDTTTFGAIRFRNED
jgi:hypothetical protein